MQLKEIMREKHRIEKELSECWIVRGEEERNIRRRDEIEKIHQKRKRERREGKKKIRRIRV